MPGMPRGGRRQGRYEAHKAQMRGRALAMVLMAGALVAVLVAGVAMLAGSP